jgi:hypothetical protein
MQVSNEGGYCRRYYHDADPTMTATVIKQPLHGRVELSRPGVGLNVDYIPEIGFIGDDNFVALLQGNALRVSIRVIAPTQHSPPLW